MGAHRAGPGARSNACTISAVVLSAALVAATATGFAWAPRGVTVIVDGVSSTYATKCASVGALLDEQRVPRAAGDVVTPSEGSVLTPGGTIVVRHAVPVRITIGRTQVTRRVVGRTVADALVAMGIDPLDGLLVKPGLDTPLTSGMSVVALEAWVRTWQQRYKVPCGTQVEEDDRLPAGQRLLREPGREGVGVRTYRAIVTRGKPGKAELVSDTVALAPLDRIVIVGVQRTVRPSVLARAVLKPVSYTSIPAPPAQGERVEVVATAYSPNAASGGPHTFTGMLAGFGIIAVDPNVIPLGTRLYVPGYGYGLAADTGGAIKGHRIDVCYDHEWQCEEWGRQTLYVTIVK